MSKKKVITWEESCRVWSCNGFLARKNSWRPLNWNITKITPKMKRMLREHGRRFLESNPNFLKHEENNSIKG
jgi:hypothetical protein